MEEKGKDLEDCKKRRKIEMRDEGRRRRVKETERKERKKDRQGTQKEENGCWKGKLIKTREYVSRLKIR